MYVDPSSEFSISFHFRIGMEALIGLGVGSVSYTVIEVIDYIVEKKKILSSSFDNISGQELIDKHNVQRMDSLKL